MDKLKVTTFHKKYPFIEKFVDFMLSITAGVFAGLFTNDINKIGIAEWKWYQSLYLWVLLLIIIISLIYYCKFSTFAKINSADIKLKKSEFDKRFMELALADIEKCDKYNDKRIIADSVTEYIDKL